MNNFFYYINHFLKKIIFICRAKIKRDFYMIRKSAESIIYSACEVRWQCSKQLYYIDFKSPSFKKEQEKISLWMLILDLKNLRY